MMRMEPCKDLLGGLARTGIGEGSLHFAMQKVVERGFFAIKCPKCGSVSYLENWG